MARRSAQERIEDIEDLLDQRVPLQQIVWIFGIERESLMTFLRRHQREDLILRLRRQRP